jgi:hypothetical protein
MPPGKQNLLQFLLGFSFPIPETSLVRRQCSHHAVIFAWPDTFHAPDDAAKVGENVQNLWGFCGWVAVASAVHV